MTTYIWVSAALYFVGAGITLATKPHAPRKPEPGPGTLLVIAVIQTSLAIWGFYTLSML